jgi:hypothetical protein
VLPIGSPPASRIRELTTHHFSRLPREVAEG